jgi:hypothetical protein
MIQNFKKNKELLENMILWYNCDDRNDGLQTVSSASPSCPITHLSRWDNERRLSAHSSVCCDTLLVVYYCLLGSFWSGSSNTTVFLHLQAKILGGVGKNLIEQYQLKFECTIALPPNFVNMPTVWGSSAKLKNSFNLVKPSNWCQD